MTDVRVSWRGDFISSEVNALHDEAFGAGPAADWAALVSAHSLGWAVARAGDLLVGFVNVVWDGRAHAWLQDTMVAMDAGRQGVGTRLVAVARDGAAAAGCTWLHVDFPPELSPFYLGSCGFEPTAAGLMRL